MLSKKMGRLAHRFNERLGSAEKTNSSDEFRALETEMQLRHEGLERLHRSMNVYVKHLSKRTEEEKEKTTAIAYLGSTMISHGDDFEPDSEFGQCLQNFGRANERAARVQEGYVTAATTTWLEGLERSLAQMKEYQTARKKLESRRLAYDAAQAKLAKSKKEDFRTEEELRSAKAKYEESSEDVYRRMLDIKEAEVDSVQDLTAFLDAELTYYERTRDILLQLKNDWPSSTSPSTTQASAPRRGPRSRTNTINSFRHIEEEDDSLAPVMPIRPRVASAAASVSSSPMREKAGFDFPVKPAFSRNMTFEGPTTLRRDDSPASIGRLSRVPTETSIASGRSQLRPIKSRDTQSDIFGDENVDDRFDTDDRSDSPDFATPSAFRSASYSRQDSAISASRKMAPPPPPPSRSKKPPPPPPLKRSALSTSEIPLA